MSRKLTTYRQPSILDTIRMAPNVHVLGELRSVLILGMRNGRLDPSEKTLGEWNEAILKRVVALISGAKTGREASAIFNHVYLWYPVDAIREPLRALSRVVSAGMPSEAELQSTQQ